MPYLGKNLMSDFHGFSDAAKLYVSNLHIVDAMRRATEESLMQFLRAVEAGLVQRAGACRVQHDSVRKFHSFWLAGSEDYGKPLPWVVFDPFNERIIAPGVISLYGCHNDCSPERGMRMLQVASDPALRRWKVATSTKAWYRVHLDISLSNDDPVGSASEPIFLLMEKFHQAWMEPLQRQEDHPQ